ncbi:gamma-aminobutyric acid type B receptor subunit 1-like [Glandiceps talaboti]
MYTFLVHTAWGDKSPLYIGGLLESVAITGANPEGDIAIEKALDFIHRQPSLLPDYELIVLKNYTKFTSVLEGDALHVMHDFIYKKPQLALLFSVASSMVTKPVCQLLTYYNVIQVSASASSIGFSDKVKYPLFLRTTPTDAAFVPAWEALLQKRFKRNNKFNFPPIQQLMKELVSVLKSRDGYEILTVEHVESGVQPVVQVQSLKNHDARIIIVLAYEEMSRKIICQTYRTGQYGKKHIWMLMGWLTQNWYRARREEGGDITCTDDEMVSALNGYFAVKIQAYTIDFHDVDFYGLKPESQDIEVFEYMKASPFLYYAGFSYDAIIAIAIALNQTQIFLSRLEHPRRLSDFTYDDEYMANIFKEAILNLTYFGVTGMVQLTEAGDRLSHLVIEQMQDEQMVDVGRFHVGRDAFDWHKETPIQWQGIKKLILLYAIYFSKQ